MALPAVILGIYAISMIWSGCHLGDKLSTSIHKEPAQELESSQRESDVVRHTFPSPYEEPNKTLIPTDQSTQPQQIRAKRDTSVNPLSDIHPDTGANIHDLVIPRSNILATAIKLSDAIGLQYVGVDVVLDSKQGPVVLELNARPGLSIQIANRAGLWSRLLAIDSQAESMAPIPERLKLTVGLT